MALFKRSRIKENLLAKVILICCLTAMSLACNQRQNFSKNREQPILSPKNKRPYLSKINYYHITDLGIRYEHIVDVCSTITSTGKVFVLYIDSKKEVLKEIELILKRKLIVKNVRTIGPIYQKEGSLAWFPRYGNNCELTRSTNFFTKLLLLKKKWHAEKEMWLIYSIHDTYIVLMLEMDPCYIFSNGYTTKYERMGWNSYKEIRAYCDRNKRTPQNNATKKEDYQFRRLIGYAVNLPFIIVKGACIVHDGFKFKDIKRLSGLTRNTSTVIFLDTHDKKVFASVYKIKQELLRGSNISSITAPLWNYFNHLIYINNSYITLSLYDYSISEALHPKALFISSIWNKYMAKSLVINSITKRYEWYYFYNDYEEEEPYDGMLSFRTRWFIKNDTLLVSRKTLRRKHDQLFVKTSNSFYFGQPIQEGELKWYIKNIAGWSPMKGYNNKKIIHRTNKSIYLLNKKTNDMTIWNVDGKWSLINKKGTLIGNIEDCRSGTGCALCKLNASQYIFVQLRQ